MSEQSEHEENQPSEDAPIEDKEGSNMEQEEDYGNEQSAEEDDIFKNNHDLIGVQGILKAQKNEIEKKKLELRMENERYIRQHPELNYIL